MPKDAVDSNLIRRLMSDAPHHVWAPTPQDDTLFHISFNPKHLPPYEEDFRDIIPITRIRPLSADLQRTYTDIIKSVLTDLSKETKVKIKFSDFANHNHQNVLVLLGADLSNENYLGFQSVIRRQGETFLKFVVIDPSKHEYGEAHFNSTAAHEFGHAMGLTHPVPHEPRTTLNALYSLWKLGYVPIPHDTIMADASANAACVKLFNGKKTYKDCAPQNPFSEEDRIAMAEQLKRFKKPNYQSPYKSQFFNTPGIFKTRAVKSGLSGFVAAFTRTFMQFYLKPYLIQEMRIDNSKANIVCQSAQLSLEVFLYAFPNVVLSNAISFILSRVLTCCGVDPNKNKKTALLLTTIQGGIAGMPGIMSSITGAVGSRNGHKAAWRLIHSLPKLRTDEKEEVTSTEQENKSIRDTSNSSTLRKRK